MVHETNNARENLLITALDLFGRYGFDGTSTRMITAQAKVNLQSIAYYFGNKEGLYQAAITHLLDEITQKTQSLRAEIRARLDDPSHPVTKSEAADILFTLASALLNLLLNPHSAIWARFIIREQMEPTSTFEKLYAGYMESVLEIVARLIAILKDQSAIDTAIRLRAMSFVGGLLIFRIGHAALLRQIGKPSVDEETIATLLAMKREEVLAIMHKDQS